MDMSARTLAGLCEGGARHGYESAKDGIILARFDPGPRGRKRTSPKERSPKLDRLCQPFRSRTGLLLLQPWRSVGTRRTWNVRYCDSFWNKLAHRIPFTRCVFRSRHISRPHINGHNRGPVPRSFDATNQACLQGLRRDLHPRHSIFRRNRRQELVQSALTFLSSARGQVRFTQGLPIQPEVPIYHSSTSKRRINSNIP